MRIQFIRDVSTRTRPEDQVHFKAGQVVDLPESSAQHWLNRGAAKSAALAPAPAPEAEPHPKPAAKK